MFRDNLHWVSDKEVFVFKGMAADNEHVDWNKQDIIAQKQKNKMQRCCLYEIDRSWAWMIFESSFLLTSMDVFYQTRVYRSFFHSSQLIACVFFFL